MCRGHAEDRRVNVLNINSLRPLRIFFAYFAVNNTIGFTFIPDLLFLSILFYYFCTMNKKIQPIFNKRIFWDVNFEQIDYDAKANFVIERVFERGDVEDIRNCRRYYGDEKVTAALLHAKFLPEHRMHLASAVIGKPLNEFRCYILRQSNPGLFPY